MSAEISRFVHTTSGVVFDICQEYVSHLATTSNPMFLCSHDLFRRWYTFQYLELGSLWNRPDQIVDRMSIALVPLQPRDIDHSRIEELICIGTEALLDLEKRKVVRIAKTINLLWLVNLIHILDEKLHRKLSRNIVSYYHREPDILHRAAGHGHIMKWLEELSTDESRN